MIINHVYTGIEMAKNVKLPETVIDFIRTHHGTSRVEYFYQAQLSNNPTEKTSASMFQYPGPIPYSKETAVVMIADTVEATSRSLKEVDAVIINEVVDRSVERLIGKGQFSNADLTFRDIELIKATFKRMLASVYHVRVEYPRAT